MVFADILHYVKGSCKLQLHFIKIKLRFIWNFAVFACMWSKRVLPEIDWWRIYCLICPNKSFTPRYHHYLSYYLEHFKICIVNKTYSGSSETLKNFEKLSAFVNKLSPTRFGLSQFCVDFDYSVKFCALPNQWKYKFRWYPKVWVVWGKTLHSLGKFAIICEFSIVNFIFIEKFDIVSWNLYDQNFSLRSQSLQHLHFDHFLLQYVENCTTKDVKIIG